MPRGFQNCYLAAILLIVSLGCFGAAGPQTVSLKGVVTLKGEPLSVGTIQFYSPETGEGGTAVLGDDGSYQIDSMVVGRYQVQIRPKVLDPADAASGADAPVGKHAIPTIYQNYSTSGLEATTTAEKTEFNFTLP
jgi:hypothetical protein